MCRYKKKKKMLSFVVKKEEEKILFTEGGVFFFFCVVSVMFFLLLKCDYSGIIAPAGKGKSTLSLMPRSKNREQNHSRKESENLKSIKKSFLFFFSLSSAFEGQSVFVVLLCYISTVSRTYCFLTRLVPLFLSPFWCTTRAYEEKNQTRFFFLNLFCSY